MQASPPQPISLVVCDDVIRDSRTGKVYVIGWASGLGVKSFPHTEAGLTIFIGLTGAPGKHIGEVQGLAPSGVRIFGASPFPLEFTVSTPTVWTALRLHRGRFPAPGIYRLQFFCDNLPLTERPFLVRFKGANGDV